MNPFIKIILASCLLFFSIIFREISAQHIDAIPFQTPKISWLTFPLDVISFVMTALMGFSGIGIFLKLIMEGY